MRKILFQLMLLPLLMFSACSDDGNDDSTIKIAKNQQNQIAYADDTEKGITFTAAEAWRTEVDYSGTKATGAAEEWVTLDPPNGEAGEVTVKVTLSTNYTGKDRRAVIRIVCGGTTITVTIEQKGLDEEGNIPDEEEPVLPPRRKITRLNYYEDGEKFYADFTYDESPLRLTAYQSYAVKGNTEEMNNKWTFTYYDDRLEAAYTGYDQGHVISGNETYTLEKGRITGSADEDGDRKTFEYDAEGRMTKYAEYYNNDVAYTYTMTWDGNLVTSMTETAGSGQPRVYKYEYYDNKTLPYLPASFDLVQTVIDEAWFNDFLPLNYYGKEVEQYIKKVTVTGDEWNKDNGTAVYRYETDEKGYITKVYRTWTPAGEAAGKEYLSSEIVYY